MAVPLAEEGAQCSGGCVAPGATRRCSGGGSLRGLRDQEQLREAGRQLWIPVFSTHSNSRAVHLQGLEALGRDR